MSDTSASLAPAPITGDPSLIESMIANLVDNAIRHNSAGGRIDIATSHTDAGAHLSIRNTGPTVPANELGRLFEPFQRRGRQRVNDGSGLGVGLAIVQAIATAHHATITARTPAEGGLDIEITFERPLAKRIERRPAAMYRANRAYRPG